MIMDSLLFKDQKVHKFFNKSLVMSISLKFPSCLTSNPNLMVMSTFSPDLDTQEKMDSKLQEMDLKLLKSLKNCSRIHFYNGPV